MQITSYTNYFLCKLANDVTLQLLGQPITTFPSEELAALCKHGKQAW